MVYFFLLLLALDFGLLGFLLHAFYFGKSAKKGNIAGDVESLRNALSDVESGNRVELEGIAGSSSLVCSLERQLRQKDEEVGALRTMFQRQNEEISLLQEAAAKIRMAISGAEESKSGNANVQPEAGSIRDERASQSSPAQSEAAQSLRAGDRLPAEAAKEKATTPSQNKDLRSWRDNLNSILSILDTMEKEVEK